MKKRFFLALLGVAALGNTPSMVIGAEQPLNNLTLSVNTGKVHEFKITDFGDLEKIDFSTIKPKDSVKISVGCNEYSLDESEYPNLLEQVLTSIQSLRSPIFFDFSFNLYRNYEESEGQELLESIITKMEPLKEMNLKSLSLKTPGRCDSNRVLNKFFEAFPKLSIETLEIEGVSYFSKIDNVYHQVDGLQIIQWLSKNLQIQNLSLEFQDDCSPFLDSLKKNYSNLDSLSLGLEKFNLGILNSL